MLPNFDRRLEHRVHPAWKWTTVGLIDLLTGCSTIDLSAQIGCVPFSNHAVGPRVSSEDSFSMSHRWLSECLRLHPECRNITQMYPPVPLIDVGSEKDPGSVKLASTGSLKDPPWATLCFYRVGNKRSKQDTMSMSVTQRFNSASCRPLYKTPFPYAAE